MTNSLRHGLFVVGLIWLLVGIGSILLGPLVGFDRETVRREMRALRLRISAHPHRLLRALQIGLYQISHFGFLLPATHPVLGVLGGVFLFSILGVTK